MVSEKRTIVFIPGYQSIVPSTKSKYLEHFCQEHDLKFFTFNHDFSIQSSVGTWYRTLLHMLSKHTDGPITLVGSSLGVWLAMLIFNRDEIEAVQIRSRVCGIVGIGSAVNGTEVWLKEIEPEEKRFDRTYIYRRPSLYSSTGFYDIPVSMLIDSKEYLLGITSGKIYVGCSIIMLHGMQDTDVPYQRAVDLLKVLDVSSNRMCELHLINDGDHRLSSSKDLFRIGRALLDLMSSY